MAGPSEYCRADIDDDDEDRSAKEYDLDAMFERVQDQLPYGSTALLRVDPADHHGQDIAPVLVARKAPSLWMRDDNSHDGMFVNGDTILWTVDLERVVDTDNVEYVVPDRISATDKLWVVPLRCIAGLGQGIQRYVRLVATQEASKHYALREDVVQNAPSNVVLLSIRPSAAFKDFQPANLSDEDVDRCQPRSARTFWPRDFSLQKIRRVLEQW